MQPLKINEIGAEHLSLLEEMVRINPFGDSASAVLKRIILGAAELWVFGKGIVVTQTVEYERGKELYICGFAGPGVTDRLEYVYWELKNIAKARGFKWVGGSVGNDKIWKIAEHLGAKKISIRCLEEI